MFCSFSVLGGGESLLSQYLHAGFLCLLHLPTEHPTAPNRISIRASLSISAVSTMNILLRRDTAETSEKVGPLLPCWEASGMSIR